MPLNLDNDIDYLILPYFTQHRFVHQCMQNLSHGLQQYFEVGLSIDASIKTIEDDNQTLIGQWSQLFKIQNDPALQQMNAETLHDYQYQWLMTLLSYHDDIPFAMVLNQAVDQYTKVSALNAYPALQSYQALYEDIEGRLLQIALTHHNDSNYVIASAYSVDTKWVLNKK